MEIKHSIMLTMGSQSIGLFYKSNEMPCLPPIDSFVEFGDGLSKQLKVKYIIYS